MLRPSAAKQPRGRVALPPGCFVASLLAVTIPLDRRPLVGGSQRWRNKGTLQAFFQASPKVACFARSFSKEISGGFVGFKRVTRLPNVLGCLPNFSPSAAPFRPHFKRRRTAFRRLAWSASGGPPDFTMQFGRRRVHRGAAIQIERILNLTDNSISGKKYP